MGRRIALVIALLGALASAPLGAQGPEEVPSTRQAFVLWQQGYILHLYGAYEAAAQLFRESIAIHPTAEAHTFLGWSISMLGRYDEAINECRKAIPLDPDFGNPYNDIGVYLIELGRADEAVPWLEKAMRANRYCCYQFPHFNLGRVLMQQGRVDEAKRSFERALSHDPTYLPAFKALELIREHGPRAL